MIDVLNFIANHFAGTIGFIIVVGWVTEDLIRAWRKR